jgi:hypothetical protein
MAEHPVPPELESEDACSLCAGRARSEDEVSEAPADEPGAEPLSRLLNVWMRSEHDVRPGGEADPGEGVLACGRGEAPLDARRRPAADGQPSSGGQPLRQRARDLDDSPGGGGSRCEDAKETGEKDATHEPTIWRVPPRVRREACAATRPPRPPTSRPRPNHREGSEARDGLPPALPEEAQRPQPYRAWSR